MQLFSYQRGDEMRIGFRRDRALFDLREAVGGFGGNEEVPSEMAAFLAAGGPNHPAIRATVEAASIIPLDASQIRLLAPVPHPGKILGVGRNYGAHGAEGGLQPQEQPRIFAKLGNSVIGPDAPIIRPEGIMKLDWEVELAAVIGRRMKAVAERDALAHVAGYTILNDISARELQFDVSPPQTTFAKSMDGFTPMGPVLVTADEFGDPQEAGLRCFVNGALMQEGNTRDMIFSIANILSYLSRFMTLEPGDIIATGTPAGVGHFREPPVYLQPGDVVRLEIDRIGVLENCVVEAS